MMTIEDLRAKLPYLKSLLETELQQPIDACLLKFPEDYDSRLNEYRQAIKDGQTNLQKFEDIFLANIQGYIESSEETRLAAHLSNMLGAQSKLWSAHLPKLADKRHYSPCQPETKGKSTFSRTVWEVKKKFLDKLKNYCEEDALNKCRQLRRQKLKMHKILYQLIQILQKEQPDKDDPSAVALCMSYYDEQKKLKLLSGDSVKKPKKSKLATNIKMKPQLEQRSTEAPNEEPEVQKITKDQLITQNTTPQKKNMEVEQANIGTVQTDRVKEKRKRTKKSPTQIVQKVLKVKQTVQKVPKVKKEKKTKTEMEVEKVPASIDPAIQTIKNDPLLKPTEAIAAVPVKPNNQKKILDFFVKKDKAPPITPLKMEQLVVEEQKMQIEPLPLPKHMFINLSEPKKDIEELRLQFPKPTRNIPKPRFVHLMLWDSGFYMNGYDLTRELTLVNPIDKYSEVNYENSYEQYDEYIEMLKTDNLEEGEEKSQDEQQSASDQGTIVPDGYLSRSEVSSQSQAQEQHKVQVNIAGGDQWNFTNTDRTARPGHMIVMAEEYQLPLEVKTQKQKTTIAQKLELIRTLHGSFQCADDLVLRLKQKIPQMNKHQIKLNMNQISQKDKGCPRLIKAYFLTEMEQYITNQGINLNALVQSRRQQRQIEKIKRRQDRKREKQQRLIKQKNPITNYTDKKP